MPGWGRTYSLPLDALKNLNIPVISFGPHGRDAHSNTERIHLSYAIDIFPELLRLLVNTIVKKHQDLKV
jgi:arginine utilization protein RocB